MIVGMISMIMGVLSVIMRVLIFMNISTRFRKLQLIVPLGDYVHPLFNPFKNLYFRSKLLPKFDILLPEYIIFLHINEAVCKSSEAALSVSVSAP